MSYEPPPDPSEIDWKIQSKGRSWEQEEAWSRYEMAPNKIEMIYSKLFISETDRLRMLGMLLENCGAEAAVRLGDPNVWRQAVAALDNPEATFRYELEAAYRIWDRSYGDDEATRRYHERITTPDFVECAVPGDPTPTATRTQMLAATPLAPEAASGYSPGYSSARTQVDAVRFSGNSAMVLLARTLEHHRYEKASDSQWRSLPKVLEVERLQETWTQTESGWRLRRRERIEGPWEVDATPETRR